MRPPVSPRVRAWVDHVVREPESTEFWNTKSLFEKFKPVLFEQQPLNKEKMEDVLPDVRHFRRQNKELQRRDIPQYVALFRDDDAYAEELPIPIKVPDLDNIAPSYSSLLNTLNESDLPLEKVDPVDGQRIFVDRLAEFLSVKPGSDANNLTIAHSNRKGDTVIYAEGYFISTGTVFGASTASGYLDRGRYLFGIIDSGRHRWESIVRTCPAIFKVNLP